MREITCKHCNIYLAMSMYEVEGKTIPVCFNCQIEIESYKKLEEKNNMTQEQIKDRLEWIEGEREWIRIEVETEIITYDDYYKQLDELHIEENKLKQLLEEM